MFRCNICNRLFELKEADMDGHTAYCPECGYHDFEYVQNTRLVRRKNDFKKAIRKYKIVKHRDSGDWYKHLHQYSKNKIHCSCPMCRSKTNNKHRRRYWQRSKDWAGSDYLRILDMKQQAEEYMYE